MDSPLSVAEGAAAMAMATMRTEDKWHVMGFATDFRDLGLRASMTLDQVTHITTRQNFGGTDCALPMIWALKNRVPVDTFLVLTDNETWAGRSHPSEALRDYREKMGIRCEADRRRHDVDRLHHRRSERRGYARCRRLR